MLIEPNVDKLRQFMGFSRDPTFEFFLGNLPVTVSIHLVFFEKQRRRLCDVQQIIKLEAVRPNEQNIEMRNTIVAKRMSNRNTRHAETENENEACDRDPGSKKLAIHENQARRVAC